MDPAIPHVVRLQDGRGFWQLYPVGALLVEYEDRAHPAAGPVIAVRPTGNAWASTRFAATGAFDDQGRPVFQMEAAAIGPDNGLTDAFYLPAGWQRPLPG